MLSEVNLNRKGKERISTVDILKEYRDEDIRNNENNYFMHFTGDMKTYKEGDYTDKKEREQFLIKQKSPHVPKIGLNTMQYYKTPFGIYFYPIKDSWVHYNIDRKGIKGIPYPASEEQRKWIYVIEPKNKDKIINTVEYSDRDFHKHFRKLKLLYDIPDNYYNNNFVYINNHLKPINRLKNTVEYIAANILKNKTPKIINKNIIVLNSIYQHICEGIYDQGLGWIDHYEKYQCVIFSKKYINIIDLIRNDEYDREEDDNMFESDYYLFNGKKYHCYEDEKDGILTFVYLRLSNKNLKSLKQLPWADKPYKVMEYFDCSSNNLKDLEGGPISATDYDCSNNELKSLNGSPKEVKTFDCSNNLLKTLKYGPEKVDIRYSCDNNILETLEGAPQECKYFSCTNNYLRDLEGAPQRVYSFDCSDNENLESSFGGPKDVVLFIKDGTKLRKK
jgi:hypothetical protein